MLLLFMFKRKDIKIKELIMKLIGIFILMLCYLRLYINVYQYMYIKKKFLILLIIVVKMIEKWVEIIEENRVFINVCIKFGYLVKEIILNCGKFMGLIK